MGILTMARDPIAAAARAIWDMHGIRRVSWSALYPSTSASYYDMARTAVAAYHACIEEDQEAMSDMITPAQLRDLADRVIADGNAAYVARIINSFDADALQQAGAGESRVEYCPPTVAAANALRDHFSERGFQVGLKTSCATYILMVNW
jgi:hypothetical protein